MRGSSRHRQPGAGRSPFFKPSLTGLDVSSEGGNDGRAFVDVMEPGAGIGRDIAKGEAVEAEIDIFISRRDAQRRKDEGERPEEEAWMKSERRHDAHRRAEMRAAWYGWHMDQAERHKRNLGALVARHEAAAERLMQATDERMSA